jgi:hypothetical protein
VESISTYQINNGVDGSGLDEKSFYGPITLYGTNSDGDNTNNATFINDTSNIAANEDFNISVGAR